MPLQHWELQFNFEEHKIHYTVVSDGRPNNDQIFIFHIPNLNFSSKSYFSYAEHYAKQRVKNKKIPNASFIFVDFPGNGETKLVNDFAPYTIDFLTQVIAKAAENAKIYFGIDKMALFIEAGNQASLIAMNLPRLKPEWSDPTSDINLCLILNYEAIINYNGVSTVEYLRKKYEDDRRLPIYLAAVEQINDGNVRDRDELFNIMKMLSPVLLDKKGRILLKLFPNRETVIKVLNFFKFILPKKKFKAYFERELAAMDECNMALMNHFLKNHYNDFDVKTVVEENRELYSKIPIVYIDAAETILFCPPALNSERILALLSDNTAHFVLSGKSCRQKNVLQLMHAIYANDFDNESIKKNRALQELSVSNQFSEFYAQIRNAMLPSARSTVQPNSTERCLTELRATQPQSRRTLGNNPANHGSNSDKPSINAKKLKKEIEEMEVETFNRSMWI